MREGPQPMVPRPAPTHHMMLDTTTGDRGMPTHQKPRVWSALPPLRPGGVPSTHRWYVVSTPPGRERSVRDGLEVAGFGTFLPIVDELRIKRRVRWGREFSESRRETVCAFPGYLFVAFDVRDSAWRTIHRIDHKPRVISTTAERPIPVAAGPMESLMAHAYDRTMTTDPVEDLIAAGAAVRVIAGPFTSFIGVCQWSKKDRIGLLMSLFGRDTPAEFSPHEVEKIEP